MPKVIHIATECYPAAKAGGLGDVVGALPKYQNQNGFSAEVIIPQYNLPWISEQTKEKVYSSSISVDNETIHFSINKVIDQTLGYALYFADIKGKFDRPSIYLHSDGKGFADEVERNISFQRSVLQWLSVEKYSPDVIHCHDHMTGLIPFMTQYSPDYHKLKDKPIIFTIHNGQYHGAFDWKHKNQLPNYDLKHNGLLDWDNQIHSLASAIKCAWHVNTVSPNYMQEIIENSDTLQSLYHQEKEKCSGILNGIDDQIWNPATDEMTYSKLKGSNFKNFKSENKNALVQEYNLVRRRPLIGFIGRFAHQKGADLLCHSIEEALSSNLKINFIILGSGDKIIEQKVKGLSDKYPREVIALIMYNESVARKLYAGCDFMMMPSRFEPCGLNQLFAMRYGTIPIVHEIGGLKDTVRDIDDGGEGLVLKGLKPEDFLYNYKRVTELYQNRTRLQNQIKFISQLNYSWNKSAQEYISLYKRYLKKVTT